MERIVAAISQEIERLCREWSHILIAIDGRCASGKSTLAAALQKVCGGNLFHMDDFFLTPQLRTEERLSEPGGNVDYERFLEEVLIPIGRREAFVYRPYDCQEQEMSDAIRVEPLAVNIVEGAYACHPSLFERYDLRIFVTIDEAEQSRRIRERNGEIQAAQFKTQWIPLEEGYFSAYGIKERCELCFDTTTASLD